MRCALDTGQYPTGTAYTAAQVDALPLKRHDFHGEWNYSLLPDDTPFPLPDDTP
ncbi:MAG: ISAzo13-like element transposase-related protein [Nocardioidaceae bacterium]